MLHLQITRWAHCQRQVAFLNLDIVLVKPMIIWQDLERAHSPGQGRIMANGA